MYHCTSPDVRRVQRAMLRLEHSNCLRIPPLVCQRCHFISQVLDGQRPAKRLPCVLSSSPATHSGSGAFRSRRSELSIVNFCVRSSIWQARLSDGPSPLIGELLMHSLTTWELKALLMARTEDAEIHPRTPTPKTPYFMFSFPHPSSVTHCQCLGSQSPRPVGQQEGVQEWNRALYTLCCRDAAGWNLNQSFCAKEGEKQLSASHHDILLGAHRPVGLKRSVTLLRLR